MTSTTRKARRKATTDLGRSIMQRERARLAREQAVLAEKMAADAAQRLAAQRNAKKSANKGAAADDSAVQRSIIRRVAGVLASEGVNVPIHASLADALSPVRAWTDFSKIVVEYRVYDDVRFTAAVLRGLFYHEGGHCRFTLPFIELEKDAAEAYGLSASDLRQITTDKGIHVNEMHKAWNCLEDQRMETAVVSDSPRKAAYFTPMVLSDMADTPERAAANYPLFIWRMYLPRKIRVGAHKAFVAMHAAQGQDGYKLAADFQETTTKYVTGTDARTLYEAVVDMVELLRQHQVAVDLGNQAQGHDRHQYSYGRSGNSSDLNVPIDPSLVPPAPAQGQTSQAPEGTTSGGSSGTHESDDAGITSGDAHAEQNKQPAKPSASGADAEAGKDEADEAADKAADKGDEAQGKDADDDEAGEGAGSDGAHDDDGSDLTQDDMDEAIAEAEAERNKDKALDKDVQDFQDAKDRSSSLLQTYVGGTSTNAGDIGEAHNLADDLKRSFEAATVDIAPSWHEQQRRGVLNVNRYVTRQPGDVEVFRGYVDNGNPGYDIAVSVLLDYSGSMQSAARELAVVAYACKTACQDLDIPCTVVLWDTSARTLWDAQESAEYLPIIAPSGGTNPVAALADLDNHNPQGKVKHLVLIMTDDEWSSGSPALSSYKVDGRKIIGLGYGSDMNPQSIVSSMERRGADASFAISTLNEIPRYLEQALIDLA